MGCSGRFPGNYPFCFITFKTSFIRLGSLSCVTRLDVLVDQNFYLEQFMTQLPNLMELGLNILTRTGLRFFFGLIFLKFN